MYQIIAPTLFHDKICKLPGIGTLTMVVKPAHTDFVHASIAAPVETIHFTPEETDEKIFNEFSAMAELLKNKLDEDGTVFLKGIGHFNRSGDEPVSFTPVNIDPVFVQPVSIKRVIRADAEHAILVGDQQKTNVQMAELLNVQPEKKYPWKLVAAVLGLVSISILIYYFSRYGFNGLANTRGL